MAASVFGSAYLGRLFDAGEIGRLFTDSAEIRAMLLVEGALAKVQGAQGVIPEVSGKAIHRASLEIQIDPAALAAATNENAVVIPALVAAFRDEMQAPEHAQYVHWGATSQDIIDTALMLRLRQALQLAKADLRTILRQLADQAADHAETPMVARTYGQQAAPTSWGAVLAQHGHPLCAAAEELPALETGALFVSLSGAAGTASALGDDPAATRAALADALNLHDPHRSWHTDRTPILRITDWLARITALLAAFGKTISALATSEIAEVSLGKAGASSTMPQKQNPVRSSLLEALHTHVVGAQASLHTAATQAHQRDGGAWLAEWAALPQVVLSSAASLNTAKSLVQTLTPQPAAMRATLDQSAALAEALSFALTDRMPRPEAQAAVKTLASKAKESGTTLQDIARSTYPNLPADFFDASNHLGTAPEDARAFAKRVRALT